MADDTNQRNTTGDGTPFPSAARAAATAQQLSNALTAQAVEFERQQNQLKQLQEDFKYNLQLLEERDLELQKYDVLYSNIQDEMRSRDHMLSELQIALDEARHKSAFEAEKCLQIEEQYKDLLRTAIGEKETIRVAKGTWKYAWSTFNAEQWCGCKYKSAMVWV